jgi:hypothetical protein
VLASNGRICEIPNLRSHLKSMDLGLLKSYMDLAQIHILMVLSHPNKEFGFRPSNPNS